ncbi:MAG: NAD(P)H-hydrate dehydratase [Chloroflexi bacterium]|nr:NAD(P)H-hydrate dehydratase [Chloroflexota bacterium]MCI0838389.1 NAD(P)H-hydrate dehydratase [Chloroflexota bacterium]
MKLVTVAEMMRLEADSAVPVPQLMEKAGLAVAQEAWLALGEIADRRLLVLCGPGNNGGDGLVAARHLKEWAADVIVFLLKPRPADDAHHSALVESEIPIITTGEDGWEESLADALGGAELVIDALLGTGRARAIEGDLAAVLAQLKEARERRLPPRLLAVDLPSGLDADTGAVDPLTVAADATIALAFAKVGLHLLPGAGYAGEVEVVDIGIPAELASSVQTELITRRWAQEHLPARPDDAHKGTFGSAFIVAGSPRYTGAAYLACMGAMRAGAGLVTLACASAIHPILAAKLSEATFEPLEGSEGQLSGQDVHAVLRALSARHYECLLIGPGLSQSGYVQAFVHALLPKLGGDQEQDSERLLRAAVIDADALNNLARIDDWPALINVPTVLTPHPGEMARLTGLSLAEVQADRLGTARKFAAQWGLHVLLKGAPSIVAAADGRAAVSPFVNPAFATGGSGDVLSGTIAGFIAQGADPFDAACLGLYVGGLAGQRLRDEIGSAGIIAGDFLPIIPLAMRDLRGESRPQSSAGVRPDLLQMLQSASGQQE